MERLIYENSFPSDILIVKVVVSDILENFRKLDLSVSMDEESDLRLVLSELLYNAVIHGNNCDGSKSVSVSVKPSGPGVKCTISDEGDGFDHSSFTGDTPNELDLLESDHGRGLLLAISLTDSLVYNEAGNELIFTMSLLCVGEQGAGS